MTAAESDEKEVIMGALLLPDAPRSPFLDVMDLNELRAIIISEVWHSGTTLHSVPGLQAQDLASLLGVSFQVSESRGSSIRQFVAYLHSGLIAHTAISEDHIVYQLGERGEVSALSLVDFSCSAFFDARDTAHIDPPYDSQLRPPEAASSTIDAFECDVWQVGQVFQRLAKVRCAFVSGGKLTCRLRNDPSCMSWARSLPVCAGQIPRADPAPARRSRCCWAAHTARNSASSILHRFNVYPHRIRHSHCSAAAA
jgi:hypothetical protein